MYILYIFGVEYPLPEGWDRVDEVLFEIFRGVCRPLFKTFILIRPNKLFSHPTSNQPKIFPFSGQNGENLNPDTTIMAKRSWDACQNARKKSIANALIYNTKNKYTVTLFMADGSCGAHVAPAPH